MGGGGKTTTTNISKTELPEWVNNAGKANYDEAVRIGDKPLQQFAGNYTADLTPTMREALTYLSANKGAGSAATSQAGSIFADMADPSKVNSRVQAYMNPWIDEVETKSLGALNDSRIQSLMGNADAAVKARSFGGTRSGIVDAVTNAETAKSAGLLSAGLRKEGYDTAMTNQRADAQSAGQGLLSTGDQQSSQYLKQIAALLQGGQVEQGNAQGKLDSDIAKFNEVQNKDIADLNLRMSALGMTPYNTSTTSTGTTKSPSTFDPASLIMGILSLGLGV